MNAFNFTSTLQGMGISPVLAGIILAAILAWSLFWKGWALWVSARGSKKVWFIVFLLVNTLGILEIIYLYFIDKKAESKTAGIR